MQAGLRKDVSPALAEIWLRPGTIAIVYLMLGVISVLSLILLTPPFQVPDEQQHFYRAYQLSELGMRGTVHNGTAGAVLPSSLPELAERFLGSRAIHARRSVRASPWRETLSSLSIPLDPSRREFVDFTGAAFYSPLPYVPQVVAIAIGRQLGFGPMGLLYAARLANGLVALLVVAACFRILPVGGLTLLVLALLPMVLFVFASASPDAAVIAAALLFTAVAVGVRFRGRWRGWEIVTAAVAGAVFCSLKPVYAPLLLIGLPMALQRGATRNVIWAHAVLLVVALGATALWFAYSASSIVLPIEGTSLSRQFAGMLAHPDTFTWMILHTIRYFGSEWFQGTVGLLGWQTIWLPAPMYIFPVAALLASVFSSPQTSPSVGLAEVAWYLALLGSSILLVLIALYLYWTPVGQDVVLGVQGRYFLPMAGLLAVALYSAVPLRARVQGSLLAPAVMITVAAEVGWTSLVIMQAYRVI